MDHFDHRKRPETIRKRPENAAQETLFVLSPQDSLVLVLCPMASVLSGSLEGLDNFQITCRGLAKWTKIY